MESRKRKGQKTTDVKSGNLREELSELSFQELLDLKNELGTKEYNEAMFGSSLPNKKHQSLNIKNSDIKTVSKSKEENEDEMPTELPSKSHKIKKQPKVHNPLMMTMRKDPRFDERCGKLNERTWNNYYSFVREMADDEKKNLKGTLKANKEMSEGEKKKYALYLERLSNKQRAFAEKEKKKEEMAKEREENRKRQKEGKKAIYINKSTKKYMELAEKYDKLKASGKLDSYLVKKRKKNAGRDKKSIK